MTEEEIVRTLSQVDKLDVEPTHSAGPFSVFRLESFQPNRHTSVPYNEYIRAELGTSISTPLRHDKLPFQDEGQPTAVSKRCRHHTADNESEPTDIELGEGSGTNCNGPEPTERFSNRHGSDVEESSVEDPIQNPETDPPEGIVLPDSRVEMYEESDTCRVDLHYLNRHDIWDSVAEEGGTRIPATTLVHHLGILQNNPSPNMDTSIPQVAITALNRNSYVPFIGISSANMLVHHYVKHIVHIMQPVSHKDNPFQTMYFPLAVEGSSELLVARDSTHIVSARVAIFYSLLSIAATNLQGLGVGDVGLRQAAYRHKQLALIALRQALARKSDKYKDLMIAILLQVSTDVSLLQSSTSGANVQIIDGGINDHWIHLEAAIQLQASRHHAHLVSRETRQLNIRCTMLHLFAQTALFKPEPKPWNGEIHVLNCMTQDYSDASIEYLYGITTTLATSIDKIYRLTQYLAYYEDQKYPETLLEACESLGDELHFWTIDSESFTTIVTEQDYTLQVVRAQAKAFHYAALIYYYRSVQNCDRKDLGSEQEATLLAMNEAEDLKLLFVKEDSSPAPITWPAFIASCEAMGEHRRKWDKWWARVEKYRLRNYSIQQSIVHRVWVELDKSTTPLDWREVLAVMNLRVIPT